MISLEDKYPNLAAEWDYEKNEGLKPSDVSYGSHRTVYWICPKCKQSYTKRISNRTSPTKKQSESTSCPVCLGRQIIPGYNSLKAKYPELVDREWDYNKNVVDPDTIAPQTNKKYWWVCAKGHSYESKPNAKVNNNGGNCPYCSHQRLLPEHTLMRLLPNIAQEWDYNANYPLTPNDVAAYSNKSVGWVCSKCHQRWMAKINNRSNGRGCPFCSKGQHTSFPEQVIFYYTSLLFPDAKNGEKIYGYELDVFIPSLNVGIEYDGEFYHKKRLQQDIKKNKVLSSKGVRLIRIREANCPELTDSLSEVYILKYTPTYDGLCVVLEQILRTLCSDADISYDISINLNEIKNSIIAGLYVVKYEDSFAAYSSHREMENNPLNAIWDTELNNPLMPHMVAPFSEREVYWRCPNNRNHIWKNTVKSVSLGFGCPKCSNRPRYTQEEWIRKANKVHNGRYDYDKVVYVNSKSPVKITCRRHGDFEQIPSAHLAGKGCRYCAKQAFHPLESLQHLYPLIADQWDFERNAKTGVIPDTIGIDSVRKFWWHCTNGKPHSFQATIAKRVAGMQCAVCHGKQISYDTSIEFLYPNIMNEWSDKNVILPSEISQGSERKVWWKCANGCHPDYMASPYSRISLGTGCPICGRENSIKNRKKK